MPRGTTSTAAGSTAAAPHRGRCSPPTRGGGRCNRCDGCVGVCCARAGRGSAAGGWRWRSTSAASFVRDAAADHEVDEPDDRDDEEQQPRDGGCFAEVEAVPAEVVEVEGEGEPLRVAAAEPE